MLLLTEKNAKEVPTCEYGYWGGFSPKRHGGKYKDQNLTKKFTDGRARLYPARKMPRDSKIVDKPIGMPGMVKAKSVMPSLMSRQENS